MTSWFYTDILGITHDYKTENVGYRHFILQPTYGGSLTWAKGSYDSASGIIESAWTLADDGTFTFDSRQYIGDRKAPRKRFVDRFGRRRTYRRRQQLDPSSRLR